MRDTGYGYRGRGYVAILGLSEGDVEESFKKAEELGSYSPSRECYCDDVKKNVELKGDTSTFVKPGSLCWSDC